MKPMRGQKKEKGKSGLNICNIVYLNFSVVYLYTKATLE